MKIKDLNHPVDAEGKPLAVDARVADPRDGTVRDAIVVSEYEVTSNLSPDPDRADIRTRKVYDCRVGVVTKDSVVWTLWCGLGTREPGPAQYHGNIAKKPYIELLKNIEPATPENRKGR